MHPSLDIRIYRIKDNILWNTPGVKNLGFTVAESDWVIAADMDLRVTAENAHKMMELDYRDRMKVYWPMRCRITGKDIERWMEPHCNSYIMNRQTFWDIGGYDEDFAGGWGKEDSHFHDVANLLLPLERVELDDVYFDNRMGSKAGGSAGTCEGLNRNRHIYHDKMKIIYSKLKEFDAETVRTEYRPRYHSDNPLRFEWERVL
jgi:hypothetical protein